MRGFTQPGAVQQILEGWGHIQVLVDREGHAVVHVVEEVVHPLLDRADRVVHGHLAKQKHKTVEPFVCVSHFLRLWSLPVADLVEGLAAVDSLPAAGLADQSWE